jgi:hypothetical protein
MTWCNSHTDTPAVPPIIPPKEQGAEWEDYHRRLFLAAGTDAVFHAAERRDYRFPAATGFGNLSGLHRSRLSLQTHF